jgi:hypothetical protein
MLYTVRNDSFNAQPEAPEGPFAGPFLKNLGKKPERLHAAGMASAVLLLWIILTESDREISGPGW